MEKRILVFLLSLVCFCSFGQRNRRESFFQAPVASGGGGGGDACSAFTCVYTNDAYPGITNTSVVYPATQHEAVLVEFCNVTTTAKAGDTLGNTYYSVTNFQVDGDTICVLLATNLTSGSGTVYFTNTTPVTDLGTLIMGYCGVHSVNAKNGAGSGNSFNITSTATCMFLQVWADESFSSSETDTLTPGSIAGSQISYNSGMANGSCQWLGTSGAGFAANTYTITWNNSSSSRARVVLALQ